MNKTYQLVEAALCIWEWMLPQISDDETPIGRLQGQYGVASFRDDVITKLAPFALQVYDTLPERLKEGALAYDWDIIPAIMDSVEFDEVEFDVRFKLPTVEAAVEHVRTTAGFKDWLSYANHHLKKLAAIDFTHGTGLSEAELRTHYDAEPDPEAFAKWWVEKYDLHL